IVGTGNDESAKLDLQYDNGPFENALEFDHEVAAGDRFTIVSADESIVLSGIRDCTNHEDHVISEISSSNPIVSADSNTKSIVFNVISSTPSTDLLESFEIGYTKNGNAVVWEDPKIRMRGTADGRTN
ncbi:MAG: hypothetical protein HKN51_06695, partial [Saprospiraceae bacterium]|nr:hypothetical protein [Saprospiraceae bacterium]